MPSDFIKKARKAGKIKVYEEVKYTDPDLNEDYEFPGFYVGEEIVEYPSYEIGDIVFVENYKYNDGKYGKNHLFVIVDKDNHAVTIINFCMLISYNIDKLKFKSNIFLQKDNINNLNKDSVVKTDNLYEIETEEISFKIGQIDISIAKQYKNIYLEGIKNGKNKTIY